MRAKVSTMTFRAGGAAAAAKEAHTVIPTTSRRVIDKAHEYLPVMVPKGARRAKSQSISVAHGPFFATLRQRAIRLRDKSRKIFSFEFAIDQDRTGVLFGPP